MIYSGDSPISDVKYGSQQMDKVYHGSDLVWERDKWVEYVFPNDDAFVSSEENYGLTVAEDYGFTVSLHKNSGEGLYGSVTLGFNNDDSNSPKITGTHSGYSQYYHIVLPAQFQNAIFCNIKCHNFSYSDAYVTAGSDNDFNNANNWTRYGSTPFSDWFASDFNARCKRINIKTFSSGASYYMGSFHLKFKIRQSDLQAWKNQYNVS